VLQKSVSLSPEMSYAWVALGVAYDRMGNKPKAEAAFVKALELEPNDPYALMNIGGMLVGQQPQEALGYLKKAMDIQPHNQLAVFNYAQCLLALRKGVEADLTLGKVIEMAPYTELASKAEAQRRQLAEVLIKSQGVEGVRPDVVVFCVDAIQTYAKLDEKKRNAIVYEVGLLWKQGLDINDTAKKYTLKSMAGKFSGLQLLAYLYVGVKAMNPKLDPGIDFEKEYAAAIRVVQGRKNQRN
jgi:tetratricopeptide (TPR) repeat protein